jgi:peptidoglycan LD-endopeptidase LytH
VNRLGWGISLLIVLTSVLALCGESRPPATAQSLAAPAAGEAGDLVMPVAGVRRSQIEDTWGQSREQGARVHQAIDIPARGGTSVVAAMAGRIEKLFMSPRGGITAYVRSGDGRWLAYYAHLSGYAAGVHEGQAVVAGQQIGFVGDTGNAGPGNTHLHFALHRMAPGDRWYQGTPVNPYPLLAATPAAR